MGDTTDRRGGNLNGAGTRTVRLLLVDDRPAVRMGLRIWLGLEPTLEVVVLRLYMGQMHYFCRLIISLRASRESQLQCLCASEGSSVTGPLARERSSPSTFR